MCCQNCGKKIHKNQTICPWCGETQKTEKTEKEPAQVRLSAKGTKKRLTAKQKKWIIGTSITVGAVLLALIITAVTVVLSMLGQVDRTSELSNIDVNPALPSSEDVQNIALFGLDSRSDNEVGRSDAIIILSIDRVHSKIKMTSIARDSLVSIEGHGQSKITHAFAWGKANLAVKTLNQNFGMNITDYAYINFFEFAEIIDYIGGVMIDVDSAEVGVMNNYYGPELLRLGFDYKNVSAGYQLLSGAQALAYSRNRYTGSDIDRGNRQKEVLEAMFSQVKDLSLTKYPSVISRILSICHTNLTNGEMLSIATWAATSSPSVEQFTIPSSECKAQGGNWGDGHGWVWHYDMDLATEVLHNFIYEDSAEANATAAVTKSTARRTAAAATTTATRKTATTAKTTKTTVKATVTTTAIPTVRTSATNGDTERTTSVTQTSDSTATIVTDVSSTTVLPSTDTQTDETTTAASQESTTVTSNTTATETTQTSVDITSTTSADAT